MIADPDSISMDAFTSTSMLMPRNMELLTECIEEETEGDKFSIITEEPYSSDYDIYLDRAIEEHDSNTRPTIQGHIYNIYDYDIVFLGFPN